MSGIAIKVPGVDWSSNAIGKVKFVGGGGISDEARLMYDEYILKTGRAANNNLLNFISELTDAGLMTKCTGLFYLASVENNLEHVKYSITDLRELGVSGTPNITALGAKGGSGIRLMDNGAYNFAAKGFALVFIISESPTGSGIDWGTNYPGVTLFNSSGNGAYSANVIFRWNGSANTVDVALSEDGQQKDGVFVMYVKGTNALYKHGAVDLQKTVTAASATNINPSLLNFDPAVNSPTTATQKMYATFNNDLTSDEVTQIQTIFEKYKDVL